MAHTAPLKNKSGVVYGYQVKVYRGRDANGKQLKPFSTVWRIPEGIAWVSHVILISRYDRAGNTNIVSDLGLCELLCFPELLQMDRKERQHTITSKASVSEVLILTVT